jgi:hypothetical protein
MLVDKMTTREMLLGKKSIDKMPLNEMKRSFFQKEQVVCVCNEELCNGCSGLAGTFLSAPML